MQFMTEQITYTCSYVTVLGYLCHLELSHCASLETHHVGRSTTTVWNSLPDELRNSDSFKKTTIFS